MKEWHEIAGEVGPSIVKIETPEGHGTGFLCAYNDDNNIVAIATAHHVVERADRWLQPIRIHSVGAEETVFLQEQDRIIWSESEQDSAVILITSHKMTPLNFPKEPIPLQRSGRHLKIGVEVAWLGYPGIGTDTLCFFSGKISAWETKQKIYLIDGVAISGVSGGPVLHRRDDDSYQIIGAISAYLPNRLTAVTLPGLSIAQDVSHFHKSIAALRNIDEAAKKKKEQESLDPPKEPPN